MAFNPKTVSYEGFIKLVRKHNPYANLDLVTRAYNMARQAHEGQKRQSGEDYFIHPLHVAIIIAELRGDTATLCAALLHDIVEDTSVSLDEVRRLFGDEIAVLVDGMTKNEAMENASKEEYKAENLRKILLAMTDDLRVMVLRLADRLHNMRTLAIFRDEKRKRIAKETVEIYAPIAHKLGMWKIKGELEDLALRYLDFEMYTKLKEKIADRRDQREATTKRVVKEIRDALAKEGIVAQVSGRAKYFYSIYQKMIKYQKQFDELYDLIAIRIITKNIQDCYAVLQVIHNTYEPDEGRLKDYIAHPKANGYRSIHTTIKYDHKRLEVQIRTRDMENDAEYGVAAHWRYKGTQRDQMFDKKIDWVKAVMNWKRQYPGAKEFVETLKVDLVENEIIVFTPKGDPISLPKRATPVDFAYAVHTRVGDACTAAKVNKKAVPLDAELHSGEVIEILTKKDATPSRAWLNFVKTSKARSKIKQMLGIEIEPRRTTAGVVNIEEMLNVIKIEHQKYAGKNSMLKLSGCCTPVSRDDIVGVLTKDKKIAVHRADCVNAHTLDDTRAVQLVWDLPDMVMTKLRVYLHGDDPSVLVNLLNSLVEDGIAVRSVNTRIKRRSVVVTIKLLLKHDDNVQAILQRLKSLDRVNEVLVAE